MKRTENKTSRRNFVKSAVFTTAGLTLGKVVPAMDPRGREHPSMEEEEWRNRQEGMEYRKLGRTGLMVSAMVIGGGRLNPSNYRYAAAAVDRGVNYVDTAMRYAGGNSERGVGALIKMVGREKLFVSTKLSAYIPAIDRVSRELFDSLPAGKQKDLVAEAKEMIAERGVDRPGYYFKYFRSQDEEMPAGYLTHVILRTYGYRKAWKNRIREEMLAAIDESLERLGTDYIDILHCPHGARLPEELEDETITEIFDEARRMGKVRFRGLSIHSDVPRNLAKAAALGHYDVSMPAYNIVNQASMDMAIRTAVDAGMGIITMKAVNPLVSYGGSEEQPVPDWRIEKLNRAVPGDLKIPLKGYLWVLQNPNVSGVISDFRDEAMIRENLSVIGRKTEIQRL